MQISRACRLEAYRYDAWTVGAVVSMGTFRSNVCTTYHVDKGANGLIEWRVDESKKQLETSTTDNMLLDVVQVT